MGACSLTGSVTFGRSALHPANSIIKKTAANRKVTRDAVRKILIRIVLLSIRIGITLFGGDSHGQGDLTAHGALTHGSFDLLA